MRHDPLGIESIKSSNPQILILKLTRFTPGYYLKELTPSSYVVRPFPRRPITETSVSFNVRPFPVKVLAHLRLAGRLLPPIRVERACKGARARSD